MSGQGTATRMDADGNAAPRSAGETVKPQAKPVEPPPKLTDMFDRLLRLLNEQLSIAVTRSAAGASFSATDMATVSSLAELLIRYKDKDLAELQSLSDRDLEDLIRKAGELLESRRTDPRRAQSTGKAYESDADAEWKPEVGKGARRVKAMLDKVEVSRVPPVKGPDDPQEPK